MERRWLHPNGLPLLRGRGASSGFTLLEVLVAIAILGLGLTVILSSQAGLFSSASRGEHLTAASNLLRCKMSRIKDGQIVVCLVPVAPQLAKSAGNFSQ